MDRSFLNYIVDIGMGISFLVVAVTGIMKFPGLLPKFGIRYSTLPMPALSTVHDWAGIILALLVLAHIILHGKWIVCFTKNLFKKGECKCKR
jgi:hypothetical protein